MSIQNYYSWDEVRRLVAQYIGEPFYRYYPQGAPLGNVGGTVIEFPEATVVFGRASTARGMFLYTPDSDLVAVITDYDWEERKLVVDNDPGFLTGDWAEIFVVHPHVILDAVNRAIRTAFPYIYRRKVVWRVVLPFGEKIPLPRDLLELVSLEVETHTSFQELTVSSWDPINQILVVEEDFDYDGSNEYTVGIARSLDGYEGLCFERVSSVDPTTRMIWLDVIETDSDGAVDFAIGDKIYFINVTESSNTWVPLNNFLLHVGTRSDDQAPVEGLYWPNDYAPWGWFDVGPDLAGQYGRRIRVDFLTYPQKLEFQAAIEISQWTMTEVPAEYLARKAASELLLNRTLPTAAADSDVYQWLGRWNAQEEERILRRFALPRPAKLLASRKHRHYSHRHRSPFTWHR